MANFLASAGNILTAEDAARLGFLLNSLKGQQAQADWTGQGAAGAALQQALLQGAPAGGGTPSSMVSPPSVPPPATPPMTQMGSAGPMSVPPPQISAVPPVNPPAGAAPPMMAGQGDPTGGLTSAKLDWKTLAQAITQKNPNISGQAFMAAMDRLSPIMSTQSKAEWELQKAQLMANARIYGADVGLQGREYAADKGAESRVKAAEVGAGSRENVAQTMAASRVEAAQTAANARLQSAQLKQKVDQLGGKMTDVQKTKARAYIQQLNRADTDMNTLIAGGLTEGDAFDSALARREAAKKQLDDFLEDVGEGSSPAPASSAPPALPPGQPQGVEGVGNQPLGKVLTFNPATGNLE